MNLTSSESQDEVVSLAAEVESKEAVGYKEWNSGTRSIKRRFRPK